MVEEQKVIKRCAACRNEKPVSEMKVCMHAQMHNYVCDSKCMNDFYNPPKKPAQQHSQWVEAVEVVAYRYTSAVRLGGKWHYQDSFPKWDDRKVRDLGKMDELMTVAQHNRIMAAAKPGAELMALLREWSSMFSGGVADGSLVRLRERTEAELASLEVKP